MIEFKICFRNPLVIVYRTENYLIIWGAMLMTLTNRDIWWHLNLTAMPWFPRGHINVKVISQDYTCMHVDCFFLLYVWWRTTLNTALLNVSLDLKLLWNKNFSLPHQLIVEYMTWWARVFFLRGPFQIQKIECNLAKFT